MNTNKNDKEKKYYRVYKACLQIIHDEGLKAVSHSSVAAMAKVSRPWIYKYVGDSKEELIRNAAKYFGTMFTQFNMHEVELSGKKDLMRSLWKGTSNNLYFSSEYPFIISLYVRFAGTDNVLGQTIDEFENLYFTRLKSKLFQITKDKAKAEEAAHLIKAIRVGAALEFGGFAKSKLTAKTGENIYNTLNSLLKKILKEYT